MNFNLRILSCILITSLFAASPSMAVAQSKSDTKTTSHSLLVASNTSTSDNQEIPSKKVAAKTVSTSAKQEAEEPEMRKVERKKVVENPIEGDGEAYLLRYKFEKGTQIKSEVTHLAKTYTKIDSSEQDSSSRTVSHKVWDFNKVENGQMTFDYRIVDIDMSQRVGNGNELRYSSVDESEVLPQFKAAADSIDRVISTVTIDELGIIIARSDDRNPPNLGMGDITLPLPSSPVSVGSTWETPREMRIFREDGSLKPVRFLELFKLEKVSAGVATVSVRSEMITIISDPKEEAQVLQQLSNGTIKFDIDAGVMMSKDLSWDKRVVGFSGPGSLMEYSARLEEAADKPDTDLVKTRTAKK